MINFKDFIAEAKNKSEGELKCKKQAESIVDHLLKVFVAQDSSTAQIGGEWERQINNFVNYIKGIKLKNNKKVSHDILDRHIDTYITRLSIKKIVSELEKGNLVNNVFYVPVDIDELVELHKIIKKFASEIFLGVEKDQNIVDKIYPEYLKEIKQISKKHYKFQ